MKILDHMDSIVGTIKALTIDSENDLEAFLDNRRNEKPHFVELVGDNGSVLLVGLGGALATVQYTGPTGEPPYLVAKGTARNGPEYLEFMMDGTPTSVPGHLSIPFHEMSVIAHAFFRSRGKKPSSSVQWVEV